MVPRPRTTRSLGISKSGHSCFNFARYFDFLYRASYRRCQSPNFKTINWAFNTNPRDMETSLNVI